VGEVEPDSRRQCSRPAQLRLHDLRGSKGEERGGKVSRPEHRDRRHEPPEIRRQGHAKGDRLRALAPWIPGQHREQNDAHQTWDQCDPEDRPKAAARGKKDKRDGRSYQRAGRVQRFMEAESLPEVRRVDRTGEHRRADRLAKATTHPRE